jgi:5-methylcytosine-specific restriction endonuclease McrA
MNDEWCSLGSCQDQDICCPGDIKLTGDDEWLNDIVEIQMCGVCYRHDIKFLSCKCEKIEVRELIKKDKSTALYKQCIDCGKLHSNALKRKDLEFGPFQNLIPENHAARYKHYIAVKEEAANLRKDYLSEEAKKSGYQYRKTEHWKKLRKSVLERDNYQCQACLQKKATEVHHMTNENYEDAFAWELYSVCRPCHERFHEKYKVNHYPLFASVKSKKS